MTHRSGSVGAPGSNPWRDPALAPNDKMGDSCEQWTTTALPGIPFFSPRKCRAAYKNA